jgi:serine/threonine protein phosphatase 1
MIRSLFRKRVATALPRVPDDIRVYAIGDIHGCDALFGELLEKIEKDDAARAPKQTIFVLLGDFVDRGPDSAAVVERAIALARNRAVRALAGNHEELFLLACEGNSSALRMFARIGGRETAMSYGMSPQDYESSDYDELARWLAEHVPQTHVDYLRSLENVIEIGDYAFVHAGIRPGVALADQKSSDLRWIREDFLRHPDSHEKFVIHGHTITTDVDPQGNRLGIDTGAYKSGKLTAVGLDGDERWFLST